MTLQEAERLVRQYGSVLAEGPFEGPAEYASRLPDSPERIVQAMKLWLAHDIRVGSLTEEFRNQIGTAASRLLHFVADDRARQLNAAKSEWSTRPSDLSVEALEELAEATLSADEWDVQAEAAGFSLRCELSDFVATVQKLDPADQLYWQRVYTLAGLEYPPGSKKRSFWDWFSGPGRQAP
jgi:hypothetical protein